MVKSTLRGSTGGKRKEICWRRDLEQPPKDFERGSVGQTCEKNKRRKCRREGSTWEERVEGCGRKYAEGGTSS